MSNSATRIILWDMKKFTNTLFRRTCRKYGYNPAACLFTVITLFITLRIVYSFFDIDFSDGKYTIADHLVSCMRSFPDALVLWLPFCILRKK